MKLIIILAQHVGIYILLNFMNEFFIEIWCVIQILDSPLMLLSSHARSLNDLSELLSEGAQIVGEYTNTQEHNDICDD